MSLAWRWTRRSLTRSSHSIGVVAAEVAVAGVEVDADGRANRPGRRCGRGRRGACCTAGAARCRCRMPRGSATRAASLEHVAHQHVVLLLGGPVGLGALVGVDDRRAAFGGEADRLLEVLGADLRLAQRGVGGEAGELDARLLAGPPDAEVVEHGDAVEVAGLAEQLAAPVDHRLDVLVAEFGGFLTPHSNGLSSCRTNSMLTPRPIFPMAFSSLRRGGSYIQVWLKGLNRTHQSVCGPPRR